MSCEALLNRYSAEDIGNGECGRIALLSQEGSVIAKQSREGWFQSRDTSGFRCGTTPALRATPPDSGGVPHILNGIPSHPHRPRQRFGRLWRYLPATLSN